MSTTPKLTSEQMRALAPYERFFRQAVKAAYCSPIGTQPLLVMCGIWDALCGSPQRVNTSCNRCVFNLVLDLGTIYLAQKPAESATGAPKASKTTTGKKKPAKSNKNK